MKGKFITFEGSEGSGKSTQSRMLYLFLKRIGYPVVYLREPGGTEISEKIRKILLDKRNKSMSAKAETLLYMAARSQLVREIILPQLKLGKIVICDRFLDSTLAYQGYGLGVDIKIIKFIGRFATAGIKPDLTLFLDLAVEKGLSCRRMSKDRIEERALGYHRRVRYGYLSLAKQQPRRVKIVKVERQKQKTQAKIRAMITGFLENKDVL